MARRVDEVEPYWVREVEAQWEPPADMRARMLEEVAAWKRGTLETVSWDELKPLVDGWIDECEEAGGDGEETED